MYKIGILFQDREFEHDIYELIRAFYPGSEICSFYEEEEAGCDLYFRIEKQGDSCVIRYEDHENKGVTSAEFIEGQSSDALISCVDADDSEAKERAHAIRKERKDIVKIALYKLLVKLTGKTLPWGNLTGIRPAKLAMGLIESGMKNTEAAQEMRERYMVSPQKTALAITIANREREILKDIDYENHSVRVCFRDDNANDARAKNAEERKGRLSADTYDFLLFYISEYWDILRRQNYLFINITGETEGKPMQVASVYDMFHRMEKKTGIKITPHMLRRYFANARWDSGWPLELVSQSLGHRHLDTTTRYLNLMDDKLKQASTEFYNKHSALYGVQELL